MSLFSPPAPPPAQPVLRRADPNAAIADVLASRRGSAANKSGAREAPAGGLKSKLGL